MGTQQIKEHFEEEAKAFDATIQKLIPHYNDMIEALISVVPFSKTDSFSVIDLGCGTGTVSKTIKDNFPNACLTCVDISTNMLEMAKIKVGKARYIQADLNEFNFSEKYNLIVSSLALHHLPDDNAKLNLYKKIYAALKPSGMFINIDVILGETEKIQNAYMEKWKAFMLKNVSAHEMETKWLSAHESGDKPAKLSTHINMLKNCGFVYIDVIYKYYNYSVYTASV
jgi:tRNA (cmo5U34)-methyltransferase